MRARLAGFSLERPGTLDEALGMLAASKERLTLLAGGTDLYVYLNAGVARPGRWLDLWGLDELRGIHEVGDHVVLGALTTYTELRASELIRGALPLLAQAAATVGAVAIQNRGTLGGNIANGSPAGDSLPPLLAYDAEIGLRSARGRRFVPFDRFYTGYRASVAAPDELIEQIRIPLGAGSSSRACRFVKVGTRAAQAISKVVAAFVLGRAGDGTVDHCRAAFGSVAPTPVRLRRLEQHVIGKRIDPALIRTSSDVLLSEIAPIDDIRSTARYRRFVARTAWQRFMEEVPGL
ncbi:MAG: xanthine dehydrogenase family protein subunit M [Candidatus Wallbacteria bacterium]|nr:xanthine dehydrogenase family protein subunit M [Candidatus Wallbacteria bacterium]